MNSPTCCSTKFLVISTASLFVLNQKAKKLLFHVDGMQAAIFLYYVYNECVTSIDDFSVKEATFNLKLAECMQKISSNLNPGLTKYRSNALMCDFYWQLSHIATVCAFSVARVFSLLEDSRVATKVNVCMSTCMCICTMLYLIVFHLSELFTYPNKMFVAFDQWGSDN